MTLDQTIAFAILGLTLAGFLWGRWRYDIVALVALVAVALAGLVPARDLLTGFGHPATITVAAVLVISRALRNSGLIDEVTRRIRPFTKTPFMHIFALTATVAVASAFMNNVGALAIMLPVALATAEERSRPPAMLLMPLAFGSILGGMMTLVGTPPNIIISAFRGDASGAAFAMFDFSWVGVPVAALGVLFVAVAGWRLIPKERKGGVSPEEMFHLDEYIAEVRVRGKSPLIGKRITHLAQITGDDVVVTGKVGPEGRILKPDLWRTIDHNDLLLVKADPTDLKPMIDKLGLEIVASGADLPEELRGDDLKLTEAMVSPESPLVGRGCATLRLRAGGVLALLAIARPGEPVRRRLHNVRFQVGDVLLLQVPEEVESDTIADLGLLPLPERGLKLGKPRQIGLAVAIFAGAIALATLGVLPIAVAFLGAIVVYVLTDILSLRELYRYIDWPVIVLLGAMIPVGEALSQTGATGLLAGSIVGATDTVPVWAILTLVLVITMFLSDLINNAATALVMAPISMAIAAALGVSSDPFLMAVAVGASCAFLTPIGHQSNTLVMGPGGYKFADYWRLGLPLEVLIVAVSVPLILRAWPL